MAETKTLSYPASEINNLLAKVKSSATVNLSVVSEVTGEGDSLINATAARKLEVKLVAAIQELAAQCYEADFYVGDLISGGRFVCDKSKLITAIAFEKIVLIPFSSRGDSGYAVASVYVGSSITITFVYDRFFFRVVTSSDIDYIEAEDIFKYDLYKLPNEITSIVESVTNAQDIINANAKKLEHVLTEKSGVAGIVGGQIAVIADVGIDQLQGLIDDVTSSGLGKRAITKMLARVVELENTATTLDSSISQTNSDLARLSLYTDATYAKKSDIETQFPDEWYGIERVNSSLNPKWTRIGNSTLHETLPIQSQMRGCILDDDGNVVKYLPNTMWSEEDTNGSLGQVMVEIPEFYIRHETDGVMIRTKMSLLPLEGFEKVPKLYISAYEASKQSDAHMMQSVSGSANLLFGPALALRNMARARATGFKWNIYTYDAHKTLVWLYLVEYANNNVQDEFAPKLPLDFTSGGLGRGITNVPSGLSGKYWQTGIVATGTTNGYGNGSGQIAFNFTYADKSYTNYATRYRGIENPFGHVQKLLDGVYIANGRAYIQHSPLLYGDSNLTANENIAMATGKSYISQIPNIGGNIIPIEMRGGASTTHYCDICEHMNNFTEDLYGRVAVGGNSIDGDGAGLFTMRTGPFPALGAATRLCYITEI